MVKPIPDGYHTATPYLTVDDAAKAIDFYGRAFGAKEVARMPMGDKIGHAEIKIGNSHIMLSDEFPERDALSPKTRGGATGSVMLYVDDVDLAFKQAIDTGATEEMAVEDQFWGDRMGSLRDPFGHKWMIATHVEDVADDEIQRRLENMGRVTETA